MNEKAHQKIAFMDTNALHCMYLYLVLAEEEKLYPFAPNHNAVAGAHNHLSNIGEKALKESLRKGLRIIEFVLRENVWIEYSLVSELELMIGKAKGRAIEKAAREGIPDRMWSKIDEEEINARLSSDDLTDIRSGVEKFSDMLEATGIIATASKAEETISVFDLAKEILGLVYLGFADSVIYANALIVKADYLVTFDGYLRKTVNRIKTGQKPYSEIRSRLEKAVIALIALDESIDNTLPEAPKLSKLGS